MSCNLPFSFNLCVFVHVLGFFFLYVDISFFPCSSFLFPNCYSAISGFKPDNHFVVLQEHPDITARPQSAVDAWRNQNNVMVVGKSIPKPVLDFETSPFPGTWFCAQTRTSER